MAATAPLQGQVGGGVSTLRTRLRRLAWAVPTGLVASLLLAAWLVPLALDWNQYRQTVAGLASRTLGRGVIIDGPIVLRLLPEPSLIAGKISLSDQDSQGVLVSARELRLRLGLWPLVSGHIDARELVLIGADISMPWPSGGEILLAHRPDWLSGLAARIDASRITVGDVVLNDVKATIATDPDSGFYALAGTMRAPNLRTGAADKPDTMRFTGRLLPAGADGVAGLDLTVETVSGSPASMTMSAQIAPDGTASGRISAKGADLSRLAATSAVPFRLEGRFSFADGFAVADALVGDVAGTPFRGALSLRLAARPRIDAAITSARLDLDLWAPALRQLADSGVPGWLGFGLDLSVEAASFEGGVLRQLRLALDFDTAGALLREARAILPGEAALSLAGRMLPANPDFADAPRFVGTAELAAPDLRTTLAWASRAGLKLLDNLPANVMHAATLRGDLQLAPRQARMTKLQGRLDTAAISGEFGLRLGKRPVVIATLALDRLTLDPWIVPWWSGPWPSLASLARGVDGLDIDLQLSADVAMLGAVRLEPFSLGVTSTQGKFSLDRLAFDGQGVKLAASGGLLDGTRLVDVALDVRAADASALAALAPASAREGLDRLATLLRAPLAVSLQGAGLIDGFGFKLIGDLGDLHVEAQPTVNFSAETWNARLALRHPGAPRLAAQLGLDRAGSWLGDGSFSVVSQLAVTPARIAADAIELVAGGLRMAGKLDLALGDPPRVTGRVKVETLPLPLPQPRAPDPLPLSALTGWDAEIQIDAGQVTAGLSTLMEKARATVVLQAQKLSVKGLAATVAGGSLIAEARIDATANPPAFALDATLTGASIGAALFDQALDVGRGTTDARVVVQATGYAPAALLASLTGTIAATIRDGELIGINLPELRDDFAEPRITAALTSGRSNFDQLTLRAAVDHGLLNLTQATLSAPAGSIQGTGMFDLMAERVALHFDVVPAGTDPPKMGLRWTGSFEVLTPVPELAGLTRWRAQRPPG